MTEQILTDDLIAFFANANIPVEEKHQRFVSLEAPVRRQILLTQEAIKQELHAYISQKNRVHLSPSVQASQTPKQTKTNTKENAKTVKTPRRIKLLRRRVQRKVNSYMKLYHNCYEIGQFWNWIAQELVHSYSSLEMNMRLTGTIVPNEKRQILSVYHTETKAIGTSFEKCLQFAFENPQAPITEQFILDLHQSLMPTESNRAGTYRQTKVRFSGSQVVLPNFVKVPTLMKEMIERDNAIPHKLEKAFKFHLDLVSIHPFTDGNGRTSRLIMNTLLMQNNLPPILIDPTVRQRYFDVVEHYQLKGDDVPYRIFMLEQLDKSLSNSVKRLRHLPHLITDMERKEIAERQARKKRSMQQNANTLG